MIVVSKIPKVIHYCWFGDKELSEKEKKCIESWERIMPDYKIVRWDNSNYDFNKCNFVREAAENKKWAFVSDYARLDIIYNNGGIYLDTDVEIIKSFDDLLECDAFFGFENFEYVANGLGFGARKNNKIILENLNCYNNIHFDEEHLNEISCPKITTGILLKHGLVLNNSFQVFDNVCIYPIDYFFLLFYYTGEIKITSNTHSIHHYSMSWLSKRDKKWLKFSRKLSKYVGHKISFKIMLFLKLPSSVVIRIKKYGFKKTYGYYLSKIKGSKKNENK